MNSRPASPSAFTLPPSALKTGIVTYDFFPLIGGIGRHTYLLYSRLADRDLLFFSPAENALPRHVRIDFWPIRLIRQAGVSIWLHLNARRIIERYGLDQLNLHTGPGGVLLVRKLDRPVVVTCHHTYRQQIRHIPSQFWKAIFLPFERRTYELATRIICVSEATRRALIELYRVPEQKLVTITNAVDTGRFHPLASVPKEQLIVYLGRIDKRKGIEFLVRSMPEVCRQLPGAVLEVGGKGADLDRMKALARQLGLEGRVRFLGFVPDEDLNLLYNRAQCVVVPSIFEGFGITVIEALAAGTRVVGTDSDGIREILQSGEYGQLVPYGDRAALARAIVDELKQPRRAQELAPQFRLERFARNYQEALQA